MEEEIADGARSLRRQGGGIDFEHEGDAYSSRMGGKDTEWMLVGKELGG